MATPPESPGARAQLFDASAPFKGVVICCTSIPPEERVEIDKKTIELGGVHKYDLTPDVTHLIVGEYDTPKYRHVAKERPDIKPMAAGWIEAVRDLWVQDADIDFVALEDAWRLKTFETSGGSLKEGKAATRGTLLCCLTGFEDGEHRKQIIGTIEENGSLYTGDLTRKVTHLIVAKPEGKKYLAARTWNVHAVSLEWLYDSVKRGMILDEKCYDPNLPAEERGKGAWTKREVKRVSPGKRLRDTAATAQEEGRRKLRKTASMKLSSQRDNLWGDILGRAPSADLQARPGEEEPTQPNSRASFAASARSSIDTQSSKLVSFGAMEETAVFASCCFYTHGFSSRRAEVLNQTIASLGGMVCHSLDEVASNSGAQMTYRLMIVPQASQSNSFPQPPENIQVVTEFFVEKCLHKKQFFDPANHVLGRPFPVFPIPGFDKLAICTAGFSGVDLNQIDLSIRQLGARYDERFRAQTSVLVCSSLNNVRKQKLDAALSWKVPVVSADWLWACIRKGVQVPMKSFLFKELRQKFIFEDEDADHGEVERQNEVAREGRRLENPAAPVTKQPSRAGVREIDESAFAVDNMAPGDQQGRISKAQVSKEDSNVTDQFETALTHQPNSDSNESQRQQLAPLSEASSDSLNKPSSQWHGQPAHPKPEGTLPTSAIPNGGVDIVDENMPVPPPLDEKPKTKSEIRSAKAATGTLQPAERLALSARLTTLLDSGGDRDAGGGGSTNTPSIAPAARPTRRRREILGRATSNVSASSSGSIESSGAGAFASAGMGSRASTTDPAVLAGLVDSADGEGEEQQHDASERDISSTQLQYDDPDAEKFKDRLMGRAAGATKPRERLGLTTSGAFDMAGSGTGLRSASGLRSRRR